MTRGIANVDYHRQGSEVVDTSASNWADIYTTSLTKDPKWNIGDRRVLPDGREYRYAKSSGVCASGQSVDFDQTGAIPYATMVAAAVGDTELTFGATTHDAIAEDELRGGYCVVWTGSDYDQFRGVIGNDASAANAAIKIYIDGPVSTAITVSHSGEVYENPYASVIEASNAALGKGGVPAVYVSAANMYFWVQTRGPRFVAPQSSVDGHGGVGSMFRHDGSLEGVETAIGGTVPATAGTQYAGYRMIGAPAGNGPLFMLQG